MIYVFSSRPSRSARALARALKGRRVRGEPVPVGSTVINWGDSTCPYPKALNDSKSIQTATNKKTALIALQKSDVSVPPFAGTKANVSWKGVTVVRHKLAGSSGQGIQIVEEGEELPDAPLYVKYIKKQQEYRLHVIGEQIILTQRKARRFDTDKLKVNWRVRNHDNGFVFVRQDVRCSEAIRKSAIDSVRSLGLDFGAVDVIEQKDGTAFVLEVNTAPGMEGSTASDYARGFQDLIQRSKERVDGSPEYNSGGI